MPGPWPKPLGWGPPARAPARRCPAPCPGPVMRPRRPPLAYSDERIAAVNSGRRAGAPLAERVERRAGDGGGLRGGHPRGLALPPRPLGRGLPGTRAPPAELGRDPAPGGGSPKRVRAGCGGCSSKRRLMLRLRDPRTATLREWAGRLHPPRQGYRCGRARARLAGILFALLHDGTVYEPPRRHACHVAQAVPA